jgi:protein SCO1
MDDWLKALGPLADKLNVLFISIDPERDTPIQLREFLSSFDPRIRGLTGTNRLASS